MLDYTRVMQIPLAREGLLSGRLNTKEAMALTYVLPQESVMLIIWTCINGVWARSRWHRSMLRTAVELAVLRGCTAFTWSEALS